MENPKIRFKGFTKDWEQRKLGDDLVSIHTGTNLLGSITNTGMPLIKMGNIQRGYFDTSKVEFLAENEQPDKADIVNYGDFFFNTRNTLELVGKGATWMKNSGEYAFNSNIARFELRNLDTIFFNYLYNTDYMTKQIHARAMGTTSVAAIYPRTLDSVEYLAPCMKEQQKIGAYFKQLDHLITLHQRKCEQTKNLKKYMLQKMFPQNGAKVPEIRFYGFTYDWEQRKLGDDLVSIHTGTNLLGSITNTGMPLIKMGNIQRGYFDTSKVEFLAENEQPDKADIVNYGDFFFNTRNTLELVGKGATWMKNSGEYAFNSNIARFELRNLDTIFFNYLYNTDYMTKQIHARAMGTTSVAAIYPRTLDSVEYLAPCMKEQQKIGAYFKQLDHLITLHQRKCDELKKMKKFMLQNMFI